MAPMKPQILSKKLIKPSTPTPRHLHQLKLSIMDQLIPLTYLNMIFYYSPMEKNRVKNRERCRELEKSLSDALTEFYPLAGRLVVEDLVVDCNDEGVEFFEAQVSGKIVDFVHGGSMAEQLDQFLPWDCGADPATAPLAAIQINLFDCGGIVVGVRVSHKISDAFSIITFVNAWATANKTSTIKKVTSPSFNLGSLFPTTNLLPRNPPATGKNGAKIVTKRFFFSNVAAQSQVAAVGGSTSREAVLAGLIWKALIGVARMKHGHLRASLLVYPINLRGNIVISIPEDSFGNFSMLFMERFMPEKDNMELSDLTGLIGNAVREMDLERTSNTDDLCVMVSESFGEARREKMRNERVDVHLCASWCGLPLYKADFGWGKQTNELRLKLIEADKRGKMIEKEVEKLKVEYNGVVEGKKERERRIESMLRDKDSIERRLGDSNRVIEGLKREIEEMVREKKGIEEERNVEVMKKNELQISVAALKEMVLGLQKEEQKLRASVLNWEKRCVVGEEKEKEMEKQINELVNERKERERSFENLVQEKGLVKTELDEALKELDEQMQKMEEVVRKKVQIEAMKVRKESEIVEMRREVSELRVTISALEASCRDQTEKNGQLQSDVNQCRDAIKKLTSERDEARKGFDEEKKNGVILREKISEMEKNIKESQKVVDDLKAEKRNVVGEKKALEIQCAKLAKEIESMEVSLSRARKEVNDVKAKVESSDANSELVLKTLRNNAAAMVCVSKDGIFKDIDGLIDEMELGESVKPYMAELEAIKNAFKNREIKVEEMKRQLEHLQNSVIEARKGKNFLTLVSSATAILAAAVASVAYVARGR